MHLSGGGKNAGGFFQRGLAHEGGFLHFRNFGSLLDHLGSGLGALEGEVRVGFVRESGPAGAQLDELALPGAVLPFFRPLFDLLVGQDVSFCKFVFGHSHRLLASSTSLRVRLESGVFAW